MQRNINLTSSAEKEVKILTGKVDQFEGLEKMFMELLKMCEQFDARVSLLENQLTQVKGTRDTFLKEISEKHEDFIRRLADDQEALINKAVERKMSSLGNEGKRCNISSSSPSKPNPSNSSPRFSPPLRFLASKSSPDKPNPSKSIPNIAAEPLASNQLAEEGGGGVGSTVKGSTDKATPSSLLSPSAPEFVLPKNDSTTIPADQSKKAPSYRQPFFDTRWYQDPRLLFQQSGGSQLPTFEPPSIQPLSLQPHPNRHQTSWYIGSPVMPPPVIVPNVSSVEFLPAGSTVNWDPKLMQANTSQVCTLSGVYTGVCPLAYPNK